METTDDALLGGALTIRQPARGYRVNSDAVLMAALAPVRAGQHVLELGTGFGQAGLCLLARTQDVRVTGIEKMAAAAALARHNAAQNGLSSRFTVVEADIANYPFEPVFDLVMTNPPYRAAGTHTPSDDAIKAAATVESLPLAAWVAAGLRALHPEGRFLMIHDIRREAEALAALQELGFGDCQVLPLLSKPGRAPLRMVLLARRGDGIIRHLPGLLMHKEDGSWCDNVDAVLRTPKALAVWG